MRNYKYFIAFFLLIFYFNKPAKAQIDTIIASPDTICVGMSSTINIVAGVSVIWSPITGLDTTGGNPVIATPSVTTTYTATYMALDSNLIINGDFSHDTTGFTSGYNYATINYNAGEYYVTDNPHTWNIGMANCNDHTPDNNDDSLMSVNGSAIANSLVYCQTVNVNPNTDYAFSTWLATISTGNPAQLQFSINGLTIGSIFNANINPCVWEEFHVVWNSGANTTATICILNQNTGASGNDFALDDISFSEIVARMDSITIHVIPNNTITLTSAVGTDAQTVCVNTALTNITYATTNATGATFSGLPAGVTGSWAANVVTITGTPSVTGNFTYTIALTGGCGVVSATGTITVNRLPAVNNATASTCSGVAFSVTPTGSFVPAGTTYSWSAPVVAGITGTAAGTNAANISGTLTNTTNAAIIVVYTVTPTANTCVGATFTVTVTVNPTPAVSNMTATICSGGSFTVIPLDGPNGIVPPSTQYSWPAPDVAGINGEASGTNAGNISGALTNTTNAPINVVYTVTPKKGSCTGATFTVTITVNPKPAVSNVAITICSGATFTYAPINGTNGIVPSGTTYSWPAPVVAGVSGTLTGSAAGDVSGTLTNTTNTAKIVVYTVTPATVSCTGATFTVTVTVSPMPIVPAQT
ncbi:MAG TPA: hypothetical protein PKN48_16405, partial [Bacteroidales bacterium]|nr:hypothetical protein [Bacteroidales bacterium]